MSVPSCLSGPYGSLPLNLLLAPTFQRLSTSAKSAVLLVVARQNLHGGWSYTTRNLADDLGVSAHTARQAVTEANRAGILAVRDEYDQHGVVASRFYSVPCALPVARQTIKVQPKKSTVAHEDETHPPLSEIQTPPLSEIQTGPLSEIQTASSIGENDQENRSPQPPAARGATDHDRKGRGRKASRVIHHPELGIVDLGKIPDPKLRSRDARKVEAMLAERAAHEAAQLAERATRTAVEAMLGTIPSELASMVETIDTRLSASVLRAGHPVMATLRALRTETVELAGRASWNLSVDEARTMLDDVARLNPASLGDVLVELDAHEAVEREKQRRIQPMLVELTGTLAGIETIVHEITMAMVTTRRLGDPTAKRVRAAAYSVADRAKAAKARLLSEWVDEAELEHVGAMLVELSSEAQGLRPMLAQ